MLLKSGLSLKCVDFCMGYVWRHHQVNARGDCRFLSELCFIPNHVFFQFFVPFPGTEDNIESTWWIIELNRPYGTLIPFTCTRYGFLLVDWMYNICFCFNLCTVFLFCIQGIGCTTYPPCGLQSFLFFDTFFKNILENNTIGRVASVIGDSWVHPNDIVLVQILERKKIRERGGERAISSFLD